MNIDDLVSFISEPESPVEISPSDMNSKAAKLYHTLYPRSNYYMANGDVCRRFQERALELDL